MITPLFQSGDAPSRGPLRRQSSAEQTTSMFIHQYVSYTQVYPLQEILAFEFGMVQSTANEWIQILSEVLKKALDHGGYLPEREPKQLETVLASEAESMYGIDGTERPRQRPRNPEKQKHYYSGKKKRTRSRISLLAASIRGK